MKPTLESTLVCRRILVDRLFRNIALAATLAASAFGQAPPSSSNLVVVVEGCGVHAGTCTSVPYGTGTGAGNSSAGGYGDNQAAPLTLFQYAPSGTSSATYLNSLVLPQTASGANLPVSGEYGSSSEGSLQLSGAGQYLTLMGYGINAAIFDAAYPPGFTADPYGAAPSGALAQSGSVTGQNYSAVPRVVTLIDANGNVNSSTALFNVFSTNNPRSIYTANGSTAYVSGQGSGSDLTGGVFYTHVGAANAAPTPITGGDANSGTIGQDTRAVQIVNNTLYVAIDSKEGSGSNRSYIGTLGTAGTPPTTTVGAPVELSGFGNSGGTGKVTIGTGPTSIGNNLNAGLLINLSPVNYFFASPSVLYVADSGHPKNDSNGDNNSNGTANIGNGGLQKWVNSNSGGTGTWSLKYTLYQGLNLVNNGGASGTTGLYGLAGKVTGSTVALYATNYTINDLDPTYLYGITDTLSNTTPPGTSLAFTPLDTAPADSNFKGLSFGPTIPAGDVEVTSVPSGLAFTSMNAGCAPGSYTTPITLTWTPTVSCQLSVVSPQSGPPGVQYVFAQWQDSNPSTIDTVTAPSTTAIYTPTFQTQYELTTVISPAAGGTVTPASGTFNNAGNVVNVQATANPGYQFAGFSGGTLSGSANPQNLTMNGPAYVVANFTPLTPNIAASAGARTVVSASTVQMGITLTNTGLGAATNAQIASISPITVTSGSGTISTASGTGVDLGTITADGGVASTSVTFNWPSTATRASFTVNVTADGGYSHSSTITVLR
jgi:Divergent InlB B-repeat domain